MIRSADRTTLRSRLWSDLVLSWTGQLLMYRGWIQWWQSRTFSAAPVVGRTSSAGKGSTASAGPFSVYVIVPLQVLGDGGAQEPEWLHCSHSAVHDGKWGESRGVSPEVHDHLHCFERVKLQVVKTAPDSQLLILLSVSRLVTILDEADQWWRLQTSGAWQRGLYMCSRSCRDRRAVGRKHSPEELQCWS